MRSAGPGPQDGPAGGSGQSDARPAPNRRPRAATLSLIAAGLAWAATMGQVLRAEVLRHRESADVRALVDSARLARTHASARYAIRFGTVVVGGLTSAVSGGQDDEQLAYVIEGRLTSPQDIRLKGVVLADWERHPKRFVIEATMGTERHRIEGGLKPDGSGGTMFTIRYLPPLGGEAREASWVLPEAPLLAPGPLPLPVFGEDDAAARRAGAATGGVREGDLADPLSGHPVPWRVESSREQGLVIAGHARKARRHVVHYGAWTGQAWTEEDGFPLRIELPPSLTIELVAEDR